MKLFLLLGVVSLCLANLNFSKDFSFKKFNIEKYRFDIEKFSDKFNSQFFTDYYPEKISIENKDFEVEYTINKKLEKQISKYLKRYRSDFASVVVIDNNTGEVLSAVDYIKSTKKITNTLSFSSTNPAASIFKVISAADMLENKSITKDTKFSYSGRSSTLYKYQLKNKKNRWTRTIPFEKAFARSNNVVFGKAAQKNTTHASIQKTAKKFGFYEELFPVLDIGKSQVFTASSNYALAELASGFNKATLISPTHGAVIASVVANKGILVEPNIVKSIKDIKKNKVVWTPDKNVKKVLKEESAKQLDSMMRLTVKSGTARGAFRPWKMKRIKNIEVAGKTGSITGGVPFGKRDWFVSYAKPKDNPNDKGISVCVMIVNVKKWYIKSTYLAKKIIQYYYGTLNKPSKREEPVKL